MNILIYSNIILWEDQFASTFELIKRFKKHNVYLLTCDKSLNSCPANAKKLLHICEICQKHKSNYNKKLNVENISINLKDIKIDEKKISKDIDKIKNFEDLVSFYYYDLPAGELASSQLCSNETSYKLDDNFFLNNKKAIYFEILSAIKLYLSSKKIIKEKKIEKVYVWNGRRSSDGPVNFAAKNLKVAFKSYISDELGRYTLVRGEKIHSYTEKMKKFNDVYKYYENKVSENEKIEIFEEYLNLKKKGKFNRDKLGYNNNYTLNFKKKINKKNLVTFFTTSGFEFAGFSDWKSPIYLDQYDAIKKIILDTNLSKKFNICIRYHPHLKDAGKIEKNSINEIMNIKRENLIQVSYDDEIDSYDILENSLKIITFGSTISYEAYPKKIPIICLAPSYDDQAGFTYKPKSHEEVISLINTDIKPKENKKSISHALCNKKKFHSFGYKNLSNIDGKYLYKGNKLRLEFSFYFRLKNFLIKKIFN